MFSVFWSHIIERIQQHVQQCRVDAAHAVVLEAGGRVVGPDQAPLQYNTRAQYLNPHFFVWAE